MSPDGDDNSSASSSSLATPRPLEDDDATTPAVPQRETFAELRYAAEGRTLKALAILSLGMKNDDDTPIFDLSVLPWSAALRPTTLKMTAKELRAEVIRRSVAAENILTAPRPSAWTVSRATEWLVANPIVAAAEVAFIRATIAHRIAVAERALLQQPTDGAPASSSNSGTGNWIGKYPFLRLIHAIIDDNDIKAAYIRRLILPSGRMAVENRRTPAAIASNVWYMVAEKWNDESFSPTTSVKDTHSDFARPISIPFDAVSNLSPATPEKVEEKWNSMNLALKRGITNWERSGQGDGGYIEEDDNNTSNTDAEANGDGNNNDEIEFGNLRGRPQRALDLRRNFFDTRNSYLLYLWDILDEHNLVQSSMQQLLHGIGSENGSNGVPSVVGGGAKRNNNEDDSLSSSRKKGRNDNAPVFAQLSNSINKHSDSLVSAAQITAREQARNRVEARVSTLYARIDALEDSRRAMAIRITETENQRTIDALEREMKKIDDDIAMKIGEINGMTATPTRRNHSPDDM